MKSIDNFVHILAVQTNHFSTPCTFTALLLWNVFPLPLFSQCPSVCYFHTLLHKTKQTKTWNVSFVLVFQISLMDNDHFTKGVCMFYNNQLCMWITILCQKAFSLQNCSVHTCEAGKSCCFTVTFCIIMKTLNPWNLFQWWGPPAWSHDWAEFQIGFPYHAGTDENLLTHLELYQIFITSHPGTWLFEIFF